MRKVLPVLLLIFLPSIIWAQGTIKVSSAYGQVEMRPASGRTFAALNPSVRQVQIGDQIRTGAGSTATLELPDHSYMVVSENSTITIQDYWGSGTRTIVDLVLGQVRFYIQKLGGQPNPYRVGTPTALIAVRGTTFDVAVDQAQFTEVRCFEGRVTVESVSIPGREVILDAGRKTLVRPGEYPLTPVNLEEALLRNRVIRVLKKSPENEDNGLNVPDVDVLARDNDRGNRPARIEIPASQTEQNSQRAKSGLTYP